MEGGRLQKLSLDILGQTIVPLWSRDNREAPVSGIALHEAQSDRWATQFYVTSMSRTGCKFEVTAVDADTTLECVQRPRLPFVVAANSPRTMRLAARFGAGWATTGTHRRDEGFSDDRWWAGVAGLGRMFDEALSRAGRDSAAVDRMLSVDAAPTFALSSQGAFADAVGRAADLGFTDVIVHWPLPGAPVYDGSESVLDEIAPLLG